MKTTDKTILNVKIDKGLKRDAQDLADTLGLPLSTVVIANLKEFVRSRSLAISALPRLRPEIEAEVHEATGDYKQGKDVSKKMQTPVDVEDHLKSL